MNPTNPSGGRRDAVCPHNDQRMQPETLQHAIEQRIAEVLRRRPYLANDNLWTAEQLADYLQVSLRTIAKLVKAGDLAPVQTRPLRLFKKSQIAAYIRANTER